VLTDRSSLHSSRADSESMERGTQFST